MSDINRNCNFCGKSFSIPNWRAKDINRGKFCSMMCARKSKVGVNANHWQGGKKVKNVCKACHNVFSAWSVQVTCSLACKHKWQTEIFRNRHHPNWKGGKPKCLDCDTQLSDYTSKYCRSCGVLTKGDKHWNWKGGITSKGKLERARFHEQLQSKIFYRDNYTCQNCQQEGGYLQVDHIKGWAAYPELRFDIDNCRTLCMACHYFVTFKRKLPQGVIWGHNFSKRIIQ